MKSADDLGAHADETVVFQYVGDFVFAEDIGPDIGKNPPEPRGAPGGGTITASRPPGRSTRAISASAAAGFGTNCSTAIETTASTVWSRSGSCCASARKKPTCGPTGCAPPATTSPRTSRRPRPGLGPDRVGQ
ncbi:hypothetical protein I553_8564 [Mycobacterium xenopi 4042]|uniref:Uncharacterized protein n=1 Tax=Mycobacterium xenopi 4042 TaxID=1299334 RepID=X8CKZ7_MYCXE|nr:hypothetical protein I553_8564 [Mycobacterium xenopi 4042]